MKQDPERTAQLLQEAIEEAAAPKVTCMSDGDQVTLTLDPRTAEVAVYAMRLLAAELEAHGREVRRVADGLPIKSFGASNRLTIADRVEGLAGRLRAVELIYRMTVV